MKKTGRFWFFALILVSGLLLLAQWRLELHWSDGQKLVKQTRLVAKQMSAEITNEIKGQFKNFGENSGNLLENQKNTTLKHLNQLEEKLQNETAKISQIVQDPDKVEEELKALAESLTPDQVAGLTDLMVRKNDGDFVGISLDLLGKSRLPEAKVALKNYVLENHSRFEREGGLFQLMALEGLIEHAVRDQDLSVLKEISIRSNDSVTARRARLAADQIQSHGDGLEKKDLESLRQLIDHK